VATLFSAATAPAAKAQDKKPSIVMLMTYDTGWNDFGAYSGGGATLCHRTPNIDRMAKLAPRRQESGRHHTCRIFLPEWMWIAGTNRGEFAN
jgi:hypothetical protein